MSQNKLSIKLVRYDDLSQEEQKWQPGNGCGKEYANYIYIKYPDSSVSIISDAMEPEDARFSRDLNWIISEIEGAFELGIQYEIGINS